MTQAKSTARPAPGARALKRAATEDALLDAFERVLARDGIRNLTVNAVVEEAGVGKPLLYRYFGGLDGLVAAWGQRRQFWPPPVAPDAKLRARETPQAFRRRVHDELLQTAEYLRSHPVTLEFLAEELSARTDISPPFARVRRDRGRALMKTMLSDERYARRDMRRLIIVLYAAVAYLAMRSRRSPAFMGMRLDTEEGWADAMSMISELMDIASPAGAGAPA
jgi:AcrR family transcriptional regulator